MKIDFAVVSTDNNELFDGFWDICKKAWSEVVGVKPLLVIIGNKDSIQDFDDCTIVELKKVPDVSTSMQSQVSRMYITSLFKNKTFLISDLDMVPMNKSYFLNNAKKVKRDQLLIYTANGYGHEAQTRYPMCYNLAYGETYTEILDLNCTFEEFIKRIKERMR